jgi:hypothetical protein
MSASFRKDKPALATFGWSEGELFGKELAAMDGRTFKAVNSGSRNYTRSGCKPGQIQNLSFEKTDD